MKYNEAIDMILDGGKMHRNSDKFYYKFSPEGLLHQWWKYKNEVCIETSITKNDCITTDWIVEKDGVVYEEKPNGTAITGKFKIPKDMVEEITRRRIEDKIIADEVNEDWLEKKMLCFQDRLRTVPGLERAHTTDRKCQNDECPFCFPQEKKEERKCNECGSIIPDGRPRYALETIPDYCYCVKCWNEMADNEINKNDHIEESRDMVTAEDMEKLIERYSNALSLYHKAIVCGDDNMRITEKQTLMRLSRSYLMREIKYLVGLQEK